MISSGPEDPKIEAGVYDAKVGNTPRQWHSALCQVTGRLTLRIEKGSASREEIEGWIERLEFVVKNMKAFMKGKGKKKK